MLELNRKIQWVWSAFTSRYSKRWEVSNNERSSLRVQRRKNSLAWVFTFPTNPLWSAWASPALHAVSQTLRSWVLKSLIKDALKKQCTRQAPASPPGFGFCIANAPSGNWESHGFLHLAMLSLEKWLSFLPILQFPFL